MTHTVYAVYDGGLLRPEQPLSLPPNARVRVTVETDDEQPPSCGEFLKVARSLELEGPPDWSARLDDFLYAPAPDAHA